MLTEKEFLSFIKDKSLDGLSEENLNRDNGQRDGKSEEKMNTELLAYCLET